MAERSLIKPGSRGLPIIYVMVREPRIGRVKTRLARDIGAGAALRFYRAQLRVLLLRLGRDRRWRLVLAITPESALGSPFWPRGVARQAQTRGDLGARMRDLLNLPRPGPALIIGSDIPGISSEHLAHALRLLRKADAVFGPAEDGGYWLIGMARRRPRPDLFAGVRWSSPFALEDTIRTLGRARVAFAAWFRDVDDGSDFHELGAGNCRLILPSVSGAGPKPRPLTHCDYAAPALDRLPPMPAHRHKH